MAWRWVSVEKVVAILLLLVLRSVNACRQLYAAYEEPQLHNTFNGVVFQCPNNGVDNLSLDSIRQTLVGLEDTIVLCLIHRVNFPLNSPAYHTNNSTFPASFTYHFVRGIEAVQSQGGRYQSPEEVPFFPNDLPPSLLHAHNCSQELPPAAASVTVNNNIWDFYFNQFLPLLASKGDDGNYALSVSSDLACLQALSRRIHFGKFVAEVKFRNDTQAYSAAIRANDTVTLTNLLTDEKVEAMVKQSVAKKAMVFGQDVTLSDNNNDTSFKVDPALASRLYDEWVIPLTKDVEIEYLLRRLD